MNSPAFATPQATPLTSRTTFSGLSVPRCSAAAPRVYIVPEMTRFAPRMLAAPSEEAGENNTEIPTTESMIGIDDAPVDIGSVATATMEPEEDEDSEYEPCAPPQPFINAQNVSAAQQKFKRHETDSGSPEFQIATLTTRIAYLTDHLKKNPKDFSSTRGLLMMVSTRRRLLKFLKREDEQRFTDIIAGLNIRVSQQIREL